MDDIIDEDMIEMYDRTHNLLLYIIANVQCNITTINIKNDGYCKIKST